MTPVSTGTESLSFWYGFGAILLGLGLIAANRFAAKRVDRQV